MNLRPTLPLLLLSGLLWSAVPARQTFSPPTIGVVDRQKLRRSHPSWDELSQIGASAQSLRWERERVLDSQQRLQRQETSRQLRQYQSALTAQIQSQLQAQQARAQQQMQQAERHWKQEWSELLTHYGTPQERAAQLSRNLLAFRLDQEKALLDRLSLERERLQDLERVRLDQAMLAQQEQRLSLQLQLQNQSNPEAEPQLRILDQQIDDLRQQGRERTQQAIHTLETQLRQRLQQETHQLQRRLEQQLQPPGWQAQQQRQRQEQQEMARRQQQERATLLRALSEEARHKLQARAEQLQNRPLPTTRVRQLEQRIALEEGRYASLQARMDRDIARVVEQVAEQQGISTVLDHYVLNLSAPDLSDACLPRVNQLPLISWL